MSWKIRFRTIDGWFTDAPSFATYGDAVDYAVAVAHQHMGLVDFAAVPRKRPANSSVVRYAA